MATAREIMSPQAACVHEDAQADVARALPDPQVGDLLQALSAD